MSNLSGECLCGTVGFTCSEGTAMSVLCQCKDCQKLSGGGHLTNIGVPSGSLTIAGELTYFEKQAESGNAVKRGFCPRNGTQISVTTTGIHQFEFIHAGSLHNPEAFKPNMVVFTRSGPSWDHLDPALPKFEAMPTE